MSPDDVELVTLFADIADSTGLYQRHGDRVALEAVEGCLAMMKQITGQFGGRVVKTIGDELMATFNCADDGFAAGCEMQWRAAELSPVGPDLIAIRIAFHQGTALVQDGDVFGDSVNCAARLLGQAKGRQIVTSGRTVGRLREPFAAQTRKVNRVRLRGSGSEEDIYLVLWDDSENVTMVGSGTLLRPEYPNRVVLHYGGKEWILGPDCRCATLGRDESNDVTIASRRASRVHARIEWRGDKFVLVDQSTNGTHVVEEDGSETLLRMEEMILRGRGRVSFGAPAGAQYEDVLQYSCDVMAVVPAAEHA